VAVKFTTTDDVFERCPRGTPCVVCDIDVPFRLIESPAVLRQPGTDTDRLADAGASRVIWAIAKLSAAPRAWQAVAERIDRAARVVMEGSTVVELARPDTLFFVAHPFLATARWKPTSAALLQRADFAIVNVPAAEPRPPAQAVLDAVRRARGRDDALVADVTRPLREWAPDVAARLAA
jgi:2-methylisocitrate lyase-like PEP mutase family enzyme